MTENKFGVITNWCIYENVDGVKKWLNFDEVVDLLNGLSEDIEYLEKRFKEEEWHYEHIDEDRDVWMYKCHVLEKENDKLKQSIKEAIELLSEEVDLFSNKATEHDINAYMELNQLDNKDAYYMATATKKAIKMLKELQE